MGGGHPPTWPWGQMSPATSSPLRSHAASPGIRGRVQVLESLPQLLGMEQLPWGAVGSGWTRERGQLSPNSSPPGPGCDRGVHAAPVSLLSQNTGVPQDSEAEIRSRVLADRPGHPQTPPPPSHHPPEDSQTKFPAGVSGVTGHAAEGPPAPHPHPSLGMNTSRNVLLLWARGAQGARAQFCPAAGTKQPEGSCCQAGVTRGEPRVPLSHAL